MSAARHLFDAEPVQVRRSAAGPGSISFLLATHFGGIQHDQVVARRALASRSMSKASPCTAVELAGRCVSRVWPAFVRPSASSRSPASTRSGRRPRTAFIAKPPLLQQRSSTRCRLRASMRTRAIGCRAGRRRTRSCGRCRRCTCVADARARVTVGLDRAAGAAASPYLRARPTPCPAAGPAG